MGFPVAGTPRANARRRPPTCENIADITVEFPCRVRIGTARVARVRPPRRKHGADMPLRLTIADDDVLLREGLASLLTSAGIEVVGQAGDADGLLALVAEHRPDIAVVDIRMPPTHTAEGLDAALRIRREYPDAAILLLSAHVDVDHALELLDGGQGVGYLLKSRVTDVAEFVETVQRIAGGASVMDPALVQELVAARRRNDPRQR